MVKTVIKTDGTKQAWEDGKLDRWVQYAARCGASWEKIRDLTLEKLPEEVTSQEIHQTMVNVCIDQKLLPYSRSAARLLFGTIRKNMDREGIPYKGDWKSIYSALIEKGVWCKDTMPKYNKNMEALWEQVYSENLECWQVQQFMDKYARKIDNKPVETPHIAAMGLGLAIHGNTQLGHDLAVATIKGQTNLPTPVLNGCRNGDFDTISCCVITGGDSVESIGVAEHVAYRMTAKKAGIGLEMHTRSKGDDVKGGSVTHLGKSPLYRGVDSAVKMMTQQSRGGSATVTYRCIDPEIKDLILLKSQRIPENKRIDKMDYSFAYNDAFIDAVKNNEEWKLFSLYEAPEVHEAFSAKSDEYNRVVKEAIERGAKYTTVDALELLKLFLRTRLETGRVYCINLTRANEHTPFKNSINLSNLCAEISLPTKPYTSMTDLYVGDENGDSEGEIAFCSIAAINVQNIHEKEHEHLANLIVRTIDALISRAPMFSKPLMRSIARRRSLGIGITGLAGYMYANGLDYDGSKESLRLVRDLAERHYYYLLKASQAIVEEGLEPCVGIDESWLPIDTARWPQSGKYDWESLRNKPRRNSVLVAHMPTESSAVFSNATNGLYPVRKRVIGKSSRYGTIQYIAPPGFYELAWELDNNDLAKTYSVLQDYCDQAISVDYYLDYNKFEGGIVPMSKLVSEFLLHNDLGNKTMYYLNSNDDNGGSFQEVEKGCASGGCTL